MQSSNLSTPARPQILYSGLGRNAREGESVITRLMADALSRPQMLSLAAGFTDNRVLPGELVGEAVRALAGSGDNAHLQYGMNLGRPGLRRCIAQLLRGYPGEEGLDLDEEQFLVTNGSQQALYILVQMFCDPGDIVLVESPSYFVFLELLKGLGVRAVPMPADGEGRIDLPGLEELLARLRQSGEGDRVRLMYLMGAFANPSTRCIGEEEKAGLAKILARLERPIPVIEDMAYRELYFDRPFPARSLLSLEAWRDYPVFY
ncbi:MAG: aminotransferase class I/II-fold pyridoxal phosphate-dependent enzyme, partial [Verrucomicrobia bacterium]|nr:aminotransferase class I/II-fold pyridoxal phosphate-dependent enzyme [Verrucomicrobiota bacterium]